MSVKKRLQSRFPIVSTKIRNVGRRIAGKPLLQKAPFKEIPQNVLINVPLSKWFFRSLSLLNEPRPEVSIIILSYNRPDLAENLVKSIWLFTHGYTYEIIVVDNGSAAGAHEIKPEMADRIQIIKLNHNRYIGDGYNIGVESAKGTFVVLMNNDIVVQPGWLEPLVDELKCDASIGAVGPKFLYPTGELQEAGALIDQNGFSVQRGKGGIEAAPEFNLKREVDYCTGATIALRRLDYLAVGGYDWRWSPGYYEDVDLCFKLRAMGKSVVYVPNSVVYHIESVTMSSMPPSSGLGEAIDDNREAFIKKWKRYNFVKKQATGDPLKGVPHWLLADSDADDLSRVGIYFPYEFVPGGGEKFLLSIAELFRDGRPITFIFPNVESKLRIRAVITDLGFGGLPFRIATLAEVKASDRKFDVFFLLGNELLPAQPSLGSRNYFVCQFPFPVSEGFLKKLLAAGYYKGFDKFVVYSSYVAGHVKKGLARRNIEVPIVVIPPTFDIVGDEQEKLENNIVSVGRFFVGGHNKRHDVMIESFRQISQKAPGLSVNLHLAGSLHKANNHRQHLRALKRAAADLPVRFHVDMERENLNKLYQQCRIYWHATGWGVDINKTPEAVEHFGISILEAMSAGCIPIVYGVGGPLEIVKHGINGFIIASMEELVDLTIRVLAEYDSLAMRSMRARAHETARSFSKEPFAERVRAAIDFKDEKIESK